MTDQDQSEGLRASEPVIADWEHAYPRGLEWVLRMNDALRALFGDPPVDQRPWQGDDFRL